MKSLLMVFGPTHGRNIIFYIMAEILYIAKIILCLTVLLLFLLLIMLSK